MSIGAPEGGTDYRIAVIGTRRLAKGSPTLA
jgi:hypothetical protein